MNSKPAAPCARLEVLSCHARLDAGLVRIEIVMAKDAARRFADELVHAVIEAGAPS